MDKNKIKNKLKDDPAFSLEVQNPEVEELMVQYSSDKKAETLNKLIEKCTKSRFLVPANVGENNKPIPLFIKNGEGEAFMPIYTSKAQLSKDHPSPCIVNMPFLAVNNMVANKESKIDGIAFNPFTHNLIFKKPLACWNRALASAPVSAAPARRRTSCWGLRCSAVWRSCCSAAGSTAWLRP